MSKELENEELETEELEEPTEVEDSGSEEPISEDTGDTDDSPSEEENDGEEQSSEGGEQGLTPEMLDSLTDEEFKTYCDTGELPSSINKRFSSKTEPEPVEEEKPVVKRSQKKATAVQNESPTDIDYKSVYDSIFRPFKANGKEVTPSSVDDVIQLMQMGAGYHKKMRDMAPMRKAVTSLNNAKINQDDLNFLIDVHKGDREAIKKLLQKHNVDPMELDLETTNYVPNNNIATDEDVMFNDTIHDLGDNLDTVDEIVNKRWDAESRKKILSNPTLLRKLGEEVSMGRFDIIQNYLENQRMFGRYEGVSDLDAYSDIVTQWVRYKMQQGQQTNRTPVRKEASRSTRPVPDKTKAAPTRATSSRQSTSRYSLKDLSSMSDAEFAKLNYEDLMS